MHTQNEFVHQSILPKEEDVDNHTDFDKHIKRAYTELVQYIDERSLQLIMRDASNDGRKALQILHNH